MKRRLQFAYRIDTSVVTPLSVLPSSVASDPPPSLPQRNLIRAFELGLPSGQDVARAMGVKPLQDSDLVGKLSDLPELSVFFGKCPLWTYVLAEAARTQTTVDIPVIGGKKITTPQLGPVGGRIVAEVFLGMLFGDNNSFLSADPDWTPTIRGKGAAFALRDIVAYALG